MSQLGGRHSRPAVRSSLSFLKKKNCFTFNYLQRDRVLTNMLLEGAYYCCNDSHGSTRMDTKAVKIPWVRRNSQRRSCYTEHSDLEGIGITNMRQMAYSFRYSSFSLLRVQNCYIKLLLTFLMKNHCCNFKPTMVLSLITVWGTAQASEGGGMCRG